MHVQMNSYEYMSEYIHIRMKKQNINFHENITWSEKKRKRTSLMVDFWTFGDREFCKAGPVLRNSLPLRVRQLSKFETFEKELKTSLFKLTFE